MLTLYNTRTKEKEDFTPNNPDTVGIYSCGPTVYDRVHIGNLRAALFADTLVRSLNFLGHKTNHVMNITDFGHLTSDNDDGDDKMLKGLNREGLDISLENMISLGKRYAEIFTKDLEALNITIPDTLPRASAHIQEDIDLITKLEDKELVYTTSDGIYFDTSKYPDYGALGQVVDDGESRIGENGEKKNQKDFAVWKFNEEIGFEAPWGQGFPGWHIECSGMSQKYLGESFDIHTGGVDHIAVHHNNEIAQSESISGKPLANYWLHNEHLLVNSGKMSKSEGTGLTLESVKEKGFDPMSLRYFLLTAHYRSQLNFTWEALQGAETALGRLSKAFRDLGDTPSTPSELYTNKLKEILSDDLNTPQAIALVWEILKDESLSPEVKRATLESVLNTLGIHTLTKETVEVPEEITTLLEQRKEAREQKDWKKSDEIRDEITSLGFEVLDTEEGQQVLKN
jgi:cysteinyl-tRNA synthetase